MTDHGEDQAIDSDIEDDEMDYDDDDQEQLSESAVIRYLLMNPGFLIDHIEILRRIAPREEWSGEAVVDLQTIMMDRSQEAIDDLRSATRSVIETSRSNMSIQTRCHDAVTGVLEVDSFDEVLRVVVEDWPTMLDVDVVTLGFEFTQAPLPALVNPSVRKLPLGTTRQLLGADMNVRLFGEMIDDGTLFGEGSGIVQSAALARIDSGFELPPGMLSIGARDDTFGPGQGTELLAFLANVLAVTVRRCLTRRG
jgi:uncharacterized protein